MTINALYFSPAIAAAHRKKRKEERERVKQLTTGWKPPEMDRAILAKIDRKLNSGNARQVLEAKRSLTAYEGLHLARIEAIRAIAVHEETVRLAECRGEVVFINRRRAEHAGRIEITTRDGLRNLRSRNQISPRQFEAGMRYRELYERTDPEAVLKPLDYDRITSPHHGGEGYQQKRNEWMHERLNLEAKVTEGAQNRFAMGALQEIAGNKRFMVDVLKDASPNVGARLRARYAKGLRDALNIAADYFGLKPDDGTKSSDHS
jgi:hypothetical protein